MPGWTVVKTWTETPSFVLPASDLNVYVRDNENFLYDPPQARAKRAVVDQSLATATDAAVTFTSEVFDTNAMVDIAGQATRITIQTAGKYMIVAVGIFAAGATGFRRAFVRLNGATELSQSAFTSVGSGAETRVPVSVIEQLSATDYLELVLHHTQGAALLVAGDLSVWRTGA